MPTIGQVFWAMLTPGNGWAKDQINPPSRELERRHMSTFEQVRELTESPAARRLRDQFDPSPADRFQASNSRSALSQALSWFR